MWRLMAVVLLLACPDVRADQTLPPGVGRVTFGVAERSKNSAGTETCRIPKPLGTPAAFERGITEITFAVELAPRIVKSAATEVKGPPDQGRLRAVSCNGFTIFAGGFSQTQLGNTVSRVDGKPLKSGSYTLRITVDGQMADVPFTVN
jgi:hypothetical protein